VGRAVTGLPITTQEFSMLPPHFTCSDVEMLHNFGWNNILEGYEDYPTSFKRVIPYLLASIVYHYDNLLKSLSSNHPLWKQRLFCSRINDPLIGNNYPVVIDYLKNKVLTGYGYCKDSYINATGVPVSIAKAQEIRHLSESVVALAKKYGDDTEKLKNELCICINQIPLSVKQCMLENFNIEGVTPLTYHEIQNMITKGNDEILQVVTDLFNKHIPQPVGQSDMINQSNDTHITSNTNEYFQWGGKMFRLV
jgi:hypothetical protein